MDFPRLRRSGAVLVLAGLTLLVTSCGSAGGTSTPSVDLGSLTCKPAPESKLEGAGDVCIDTGIRSQSLFSFANWGGRRYKADSFGFAELIALYGESEVCGKEGQATCDVSPKARVIRDAIDNMLQNGRCEGLSALGALYMTSKGPNPKTFGAPGVQSLSPAIDAFADIIDYWWGTQFLSGVGDSSSASRGSNVEKVLSQVVAGLSAGTGITVGLYSEQGAHSVLPVAVTRSADGSYVMHVWDSNNPRVLGQVVVDTKAGTWSYAGARVNSGAQSATWTGGKGTIDAVPLSARTGKPILKVGGDQKGSASVVATSSSAAPTELTVTMSDGKKLIASATGVVGAIPGVTATPMRNGDLTQLVVTFPEGTTGFTAALATGADATTGLHGASQLTVDSGAAQVMTMAIPASRNDAAASVSLSAGDAGANLSATAVGSVAVSAATQSSVLSIPLESRDSVTVEPSAQSGVDAVVTLDPATGETQKVTVADPKSGISQDVVLVRTENGSLQSIANPLTPVTVDRGTLDRLAETAGSATAGAASGASVPELPEGAADIDVTGTTGPVTDTSAVINSKVSTADDAVVWIEYSPNGDWSTVTKSAKSDVAAGLGANVRSSLENLVPGTEYRYRTAVDVAGFVVHSAYATFTTTGTSPDDFATAVSDANIKVESSLVVSTATGGVLSSKVSAPVASKVWVEYALTSNPSDIMRTPEQTVAKGTAVQVLTVLNGLAFGQTYTYRTVVKARDAVGYSVANSLVTGETAGSGRVPVSAIGATISMKVGEVTATTASLALTVTSATAGRVQVEYQRDGDAASTRTKAQVVAAGTGVKVAVQLTGLRAGSNYRARALVTAGGLTVYGQFRSFTTPAEKPTDTSQGLIDAPIVPAAGLTATGAGFESTVRSPGEGSVSFEFGMDNDSTVLYETQATPVTSTTKSVRVDIDRPPLRAGTPFRVRAVLVTGGQTYRTLFTNFTTAGTMDTAQYQPSAPSLRRTADGAAVTFGIPVAEVPSIITFRVLDGSTVVCSVPAGSLGCDAVITSYGTRSLVVVAYRSGTEIARSAASTINIGGTPTVSNFTSVSSTSSALAFTYSFDPRGETVQYGLEVRLASNDSLVAPFLGGQTSTAVSGATQQATGLSASTQYKVRLILMYGSNVVGSTWLTVSTN